MLLKKINLFDFAKFFAFYNFLITLLFVVLEFLIKVLGLGSSLLGNMSYTYLLLSGGAMLVLSPVIGFVLGLIIAGFVNMALKLLGGIKIDVE